MYDLDVYNGAFDLAYDEVFFGEAVVVVAGPFCVESRNIYVPGPTTQTVYVPGPQRQNIYTPGAERQNVCS